MTRTHPLKAWRLTQRYPHPKTGRDAVMSASECARRIAVTPMMWLSWEKYPDEKGANIPSLRNMQAIYRLTRGQVRPDHFYQLDREAS